tara:strand:+ start:8068 stop:8334 length:267 start_codon:yes stop_codon:yes gene_type:complete
MSKITHDKAAHGSSLKDLNNILFDQLNRLNDPETTGDKLAQEIQRTSAMTDASKTIISNATLRLDALKVQAEYKGLSIDDIPNLIEAK